MKKITKSEFDKMEFSYNLREVSKWYQVFTELEEGEGVIISKEEWTLKTTPSIYSRTFKRNKLFIMKCRELKDRTGWACLKVKNLKNLE